MTLEKDNLKQWKAHLDKGMKSMYGAEDYSQCCSDEEWVENYTGYTTQDAIDDEVQYWD